MMNTRIQTRLIKRTCTYYELSTLLKKFKFDIKKGKTVNPLRIVKVAELMDNIQGNIRNNVEGEKCYWLEYFWHEGWTKYAKKNFNSISH